MEGQTPDTVESHPFLEPLVSLENLNPQFDDSILQPETIIEHVEDLLKVNEPIPHSQILSQLSEKIQPIDFRELACLSHEDNPKNNHYQILTVEQIFDLANRNQWGICMNHDFVYLFNGAYWSLLEIEELKSFLGESAEKMGVDKFKARHYNFRDQLYKQFLALANLPKPDYPKDMVLINLKNGTFEIKTDGTKLREFNRNDFITYQLPFAYDPQAKAEVFMQYLDKVLPDKVQQNILAEYLGYVFIQPSTLKLEKTLLLYGPGANGKSVFFEIVNALLGEENVSSYSLQSLTNENGYYRAMLANKLVNYGSEINGKLETSIFKQLVSGEKVEARLPYHDPFMIENYAKLIFNCNELPRDVEHSHAYFRRFLIIAFNVIIPEDEQDKQLAAKIIENELSGVFNWVLEGLKRLLSQKRFTDSDTVKQQLEQYKKQSDSVHLFIEDQCYKASPKEYKLIKELYVEYRSYCSDDGMSPVKKINFNKRLQESGFIIEKKNIGNVVFLEKQYEPF